MKITGSRRVGHWSATVSGIALVALAGCGGDGGDTTQGTPLSKSDFIAQADSICVEKGKEVDQAAEELFASGQPTDGQLEEFITDEAVPNLEQQANAIDELGAPSGDEDRVDELLEALRDAIEELKADPVASFESADDGGPFAEANRIAQDYGLQECGSEG